MKYWILLALLVLIAFIPGVSAWTESYQGQTNATWAIGAGADSNQHASASIISDSNSVGNYYLKCLYTGYFTTGGKNIGTVIVGQSDASQYMAFTLFDNQYSSYTGHAHGMYGTLSINLYDRYYNVIGQFTNLNYTYNGFYLYTQGRYEIKRTASTGSTVLYFNGVPVQTIVTATEPFNFGLNFVQQSHTETATDYVCIDDVIQQSQTLNGGYIVGGIPANWYIRKDIVGLTVNGLYNNASAVVNTSAFNTSYGKPSAETRLIYLVSSDQTVWQTQSVNDYNGYSTFNLTSFMESSAPYGEYWLQFENYPNYYTPIWYIGVGASIAWDKTTYPSGSTAVINYTITNSYYDPSSYTYKIAIVNVYGESIGTNTTVAAQTGEITKVLDPTTFPNGVYYAEIIATPIAGGSDIIMNYAATEITEYVYLSGYVLNAETAGVLSGANVTVFQAGVNVSYISSASGQWGSTGQNWITGQAITIFTHLSGYTNDTISLTPLTAGNINSTVVLVPSTPSYTGVAIGGVVRDTQYQNPIPSATYHVKNTTEYTCTTNAAGYCNVGNLINGTIYNVWSSRTGYGNLSVHQVTAIGV